MCFGYSPWRWQSKRQHAVFRELLQNSDDAGSKAVEIRFETKGYIDRKNSSEDLDDQAQAPPLQDESLPDLKTALVRSFRCSTRFVDLISLDKVHRWTFKNNGMLFRDQDWTRLKKIGTERCSAELSHS